MYTDRFKPRRSVEKRYAAAINRIMEGLRRRLTGASSPFQMLQALRGFARSPDAAPGVGIYIYSSRLKETSMKLSEELNLQEQKIKRLEHQMVIAKRQRDVWAAIAVVSIGRITFYRL